MTVREAIMLNVPAPGNAGFTRAELINRATFEMRGKATRESVRDKLKRMIRDCEITEWASGGITQNS